MWQPKLSWTGGFGILTGTGLDGSSGILAKTLHQILGQVQGKTRHGE